MVISVFVFYNLNDNGQETTVRFYRDLRLMSRDNAHVTASNVQSKCTCTILNIAPYFSSLAFAHGWSFPGVCSCWRCAASAAAAAAAAAAADAAATKGGFRHTPPVAMFLIVLHVSLA
jgi:hypothetical protein